MVRLTRGRRRGTSGEDGHLATEESAVGTTAEPIAEPIDETDAMVVDGVGDPREDAHESVDESPDEDLAEEAEDGGVADAPTAPRPTAAVRELGAAGSGRFSPRSWTPLLLLRTTHPKQAVLTALCVGGVAVLTGRSAKEVGVIVCTVLVGQAILGWHNDVVDRRKDQDNQVPGKPVADGRLGAGTVWYAIIAAFWVLLPLAVTTGITAGCIYMGSVAVGMLGNVLFRTGFLSWWSWAASFAMLPAYLSYGGWGGQAEGSPPETSITVLAALLGIGIHFLRSVWGLVADHAEGWTYLPLKLGMKMGATRLLMLSTLYVAVIAGLLAVFGVRDGLSR